MQAVYHFTRRLFCHTWDGPYFEHCWPIFGALVGPYLEHSLGGFHCSLPDYCWLLRQTSASLGSLLQRLYPRMTSVDATGTWQNLFLLSFFHPCWSCSSSWRRQVSLPCAWRILSTDVIVWGKGRGRGWGETTPTPWTNKKHHHHKQTNKISKFVSNISIPS